MLLAASSEVTVHPLVSISGHVAGLITIIQASFIGSSPVGIVQTRRCSRGCAHTFGELPAVVLGAAVSECIMQPHAGVLYHIIGSRAVVLACVIAKPVGVVLRSTAARRRSSHTPGQVKRVVFLTTISLGAKEVVRGILRHVERFVTIAGASRIGALPVGVPKCTSTCIVEVAHATIVVPGEVSCAAAIESGVHVSSWVGINVGWLITVIQTSRRVARGFKIWVEEVYRRGRSGGR